MTSGLPTLTIAPDKLTAYLLNVHHMAGASKARWFLSKGYSTAAPDLLALNLAQHAFAGWPGETENAPPHGVKHKILAPMLCPDGSSPYILSIWMNEPGEPVIRFITARPFRVKADPK